jgi:hypothetical protein
MKPAFIALGVLFLGGCAAPHLAVDDSRMAQLEHQMNQVAMREQVCMRAASTKEAYALTQIGPDSDSFAAMDKHAVRSNYDLDSRQCRADAAFEREAVAAQERKEYELEARRQRDLNALMPTLMASGPP